MGDRILSESTCDGDWAAYYKNTGKQPPRKTLIQALDAFDEDGVRENRNAVDLGCGSGRDTIEILRRGWSVLAVDSSKEAFRSLLSRNDLPVGVLLETQHTRFEKMNLPMCDLINAGFSLPLCPKEAFPTIWKNIVSSLREGGRFSGQFYGDRDSWNTNPDLTCLTREETEGYLSALVTELFQEEEEDSLTPRGTSKHCHIFHVVARKP